jgi:tight adherence protein C
VPSRRGQEARAAQDRSRVDKLEKFAHFLEPQKKEELSAAKLKMLRAGYTGKNAVRMFHAIQFLLAIGFLLIGGLIIALVKSFCQEMTMGTPAAQPSALRLSATSFRATG